MWCEHNMMTKMGNGKNWLLKKIRRVWFLLVIAFIYVRTLAITSTWRGKMHKRDTTRRAIGRDSWSRKRVAARFTSATRYIWERIQENTSTFMVVWCEHGSKIWANIKPWRLKNAMLIVIASIGQRMDVAVRITERRSATGRPRLVEGAPPIFTALTWVGAETLTITTPETTGSTIQWNARLPRRCRKRPLRQPLLLLHRLKRLQQSQIGVYHLIRRVGPKFQMAL